MFFAFDKKPAQARPRPSSDTNSLASGDDLTHNQLRQAGKLSMGLGIEIQAPTPSRESTSERRAALEERLRTSTRRNQAAAAKSQTSAPNTSADTPGVYDRRGRTSGLTTESAFDPGERPPHNKAFAARRTDQSFGVTPQSVTGSELAAAPRLSPSETHLIQAALNLAAQPRSAAPSPAPAAAPVAAVAATLNATSAPGGAPSPPPATSLINRGSGKAPDVGLKAPVSIPRAASPQDLMRVASALRSLLLRSSEPTLRDRELAGLASKVEAQARAMSKAESEQRMALLKEGLERPDVAIRVVRPEMEHILLYLDDLSRSRPEALSYYAEEKMRDLVLDVAAEDYDLRMLDSVNYDLINGVFVGDPADESFIEEVLELRDPYPGETVFVE